MTARWSFSRRRDCDQIATQIVDWKGPYCLPTFQAESQLECFPDIPAVYMFSFPYANGFVMEATGVTKSTKRRIATHLREYRKGNYNILDMKAVSECKRVEVWHGWGHSKKDRDEFERNREYYDKAIQDQLKTYRIFVAEIDDKRIRERIEASIMINAYTSKEFWADFAPRWMHLVGRYNHEMPINTIHKCDEMVYGLPVQLEI